MKMIFRSDKHSVRYSWIVSYVSLLLISVITTGVVSTMSKNMIETEINHSNDLVLYNIRDNIDNIITDADRLSLELSENKMIQEIAGMDASDAELNFNLYKTSQDLSKYRIISNSFKRFYIYFNKLGVVVTSGYVNTQENYYTGYLASDSYSINSWLTAMQKKYNKDYLIMPYHEDVTGDTLSLAMIRSISVPLFGELSANIVILLDFDSILEQNKRGMEYLANNNLFILDKNNTYIAGKNIGLFADQYDKIEMKAPAGRVNKVINGQKLVISYTTSRINGWRYIITTPENIFWIKSQYLRNFLLCALLLYILLGVFLSFYFLRRNYDPLKRVVESIKNKMTNPIASDKNEFNFLQNSFNETIEEKKEVLQKLEKQSRMLKSNFLFKLIKGGKTKVPIHELLTAYDLSFKYEKFAVLIIYIQSMNEESWKNYKNERIDKYDLSRFIIINVIEELLGRSFISQTTEVEDMLVSIINIRKDHENYKKDIIGALNESVEFIQKNYEISIVFAVSSIHDSMSDVPSAFTEALEAMEYQNIMGSSRILFYDEIVTDMDEECSFQLDQEYQIVNCVINTDFKSASLLIEDVFKNELAKKSVSLDMARFLMLNLIGTVLKAIVQTDPEIDKRFFESSNPMNELMKCKSLMEIKNKVLEIIKEVCLYKESNLQQHVFKIRDSVREIVKSNYSDVNFGIAAVAEKLGKSPYYVSKVYKEETGEGILDYINFIRIEKAKELIRELGSSQKEVCEMVGFTNVRTFQRVFKRVEGLTPGRLKE